MKKKDFMQKSIMTALTIVPEDTERCTKFDVAIAICEKAWAKLEEKGYGEPVAKGSSVVKKLSESREYSDEFEKAWKLYSAKPKGDKGQAWEYWQALRPDLYKWIYSAIPKYIGSLSGGLNAAHFSTFISRQYWESFPITADRPVAAHNPGNEAKALQRLIDNTVDPATKKSLQGQLDKLRA